MERLDEHARDGQVLVLVALALLVLVAIVALAVDVGSLYAERRKMQNAADAGALAAARVLCYDSDATETAVREEGWRYAVTYNGAHGAEVTPSGKVSVTVVATETANTLFARVMGFRTADVSARATAMCQAPHGAGGLWPLAINEIVYTNDITVPCGSLFFAFIDVNADDIDDIDDCNFAEAEFTFYEEPACVDPDGYPIAFPAAEEIGHIGPGDMGWLRFPEPVDPDLNPCLKEAGNCGANALNCWLEESHPGPINIGDCVPGEPGGNASTEAAVETNTCDIRNLILFDEECDPDEEMLGSCPGTPYRVSGFGCVRVIDFAKVTVPLKSKPNQTCGQPNSHVVIVQKMCAKDKSGVVMEGYQEFCMTVAGDGGYTAPDPEGIVVIRLVE